MQTRRSSSPISRKITRVKLPTVAYKSKSKQLLDEVVAAVASSCIYSSIKEAHSTEEFKILVECSNDNDLNTVRFCVTQIKEQIKNKQLTEKVVNVLQHASNGNGKMLRLMNGDLVRLSPVNAKAITQVHDQLSETNQTLLRTMMIESKHCHDAVVDFCNERIKE